jgi:hypothetical protein
VGELRDVRETQWPTAKRQREEGFPKVNMSVDLDRAFPGRRAKERLVDILSIPPHLNAHETASAN